MTQISNINSYADRLRGFIFSPSSCYPKPVAYVVDGFGTILHTWSHTMHQPKPEDNPPRYLRGWNHVEVDSSNNLFAIVPLRSLLKLTPKSKLLWSCDVTAHHDLAIDDDGAILVLTETPRRVLVDGRCYNILDNLVTFIDPYGTVKEEVSLYDVLWSNSSLQKLIYESIRFRKEAFQCRKHQTLDGISLKEFYETQATQRLPDNYDDRRRILQRIRDLPGSPCDVLHTNTLELVESHPMGIWSYGDILICMRELNTIAIVDLNQKKVRWWWGLEKLSGPHQPSVLPDGRIIVFDNGVDMRRTRLVVVDPIRNEVVWSWAAQPPQSFFCPLAGGCERLSNGNLLVTNSTAGEAFELTFDGQIIWKLTLQTEVFGAERGRVSIYRMSALEHDIIAQFPLKSFTATAGSQTVDSCSISMVKSGLDGGCL
jgi:hypothetical protein